MHMGVYDKVQNACIKPKKLASKRGKKCLNTSFYMVTV